VRSELLQVFGGLANLAVAVALRSFQSGVDFFAFERR
jgi:hypothetical protein